MAYYIDQFTPNEPEKTIMSKKSKKRDPFAKREAQKYEHPIPSREYIMQQLEEEGRPVSFENLYPLLQLSDQDELRALDYRLRAMMRDGQIMQDRRGRYCLVDKLELIKGRVIGHPDGFGFVVPDLGGDDLFLSPKQMKQVFHGDRVLVREEGRDRRGRRTGAIFEVIERNTHEIVGRLFIEGSIAFVVPDNKRINRDIHIPNEELNGATHGQIVTVDIIAQPTRRGTPVGRVAEVIGEHMAPGMEIDIAIRAHELPHRWPQSVLDEAEDFDLTVPEEAIKSCKDLRDVPLVTIDGEDARDFDDAVFCRPKPRGGWVLLVAIADVSHYVQVDSALDQEAAIRGNSVYFPERVVPMLPEVLSNGLCSLNPHVDRLCMVCEMSISASGRLLRYTFYNAVMNSKARLTYTNVAAMLQDENPELISKYADIYPHLTELYSLYKVLHAARVKRGAIEFDTTETQIVFGENKKIEKIVPLVRNDAHRLIEECMLLANISAAKFLIAHKIPGLFRSHAPPSTDKITELREFLSELGLQLKGGKNPKPKHFCEVLDAIQGRPDKHLIQMVLLRSLSQAIYSTENVGHFGLAFDAYTHFTSPIRRYPDLLTHRAIRHIINHQPVETFDYDKNQMEKLGQHCSLTERRADEATRDAVDWLKCEYMLDHIGGKFAGVISAVTNFGIFVELKDIYVEGLVHVTGLHGDYYHYDPIKHRLRGERTGTTYRLGDTITVVVTRVDLDERKIDFMLA